jgi:hypothetical protein
MVIWVVQFLREGCKLNSVLAKNLHTQIHVIVRKYQNLTFKVNFQCQNFSNEHLTFSIFDVIKGLRSYVMSTLVIRNLDTIFPHIVAAATVAAATILF